MLVFMAGCAAGALAAWLALFSRLRAMAEVHRVQLLSAAKWAEERVAAVKAAIPPPPPPAPPLIIVDPAPERFRVILYLERGARARDVYDNLARHLASADERVQFVDGVTVRGEKRGFPTSEEDD